ncbi:MAG: pyridoxine 5'-phosphate oxidase C-terminal domain-containing protein, partial [Bacteroidales bacterium]|nr:pyridoxine 5'-phosphate oxidase C-terminal domain-containing protein [Bacteroidales bacterium]
PYESRIGALVSKQSAVIADREELDREFARLFDSMKANQEEMTRPEFWGGYAFDPVSVEFWQGRANRLHDRLRYRMTKNNWARERLSP